MEATAATLERRVQVIPATRKPEELHRDHDGKMRVAAYCRVSTDSEEQLNSYEAQKTYYTQKIQDSPDWEMAGIYADEGISGTSLKKRTQFNKMITACKRGHIDLIITKSLSRFARNTVDCLDTVRLLKSNGIGVYFEKENINTLTESSEFLITLFSGHEFTKRHRWLYRRFGAVAQWMKYLSNREALEQGSSLNRLTEPPYTVKWDILEFIDFLITNLKMSILCCFFGFERRLCLQLKIFSSADSLRIAKKVRAIIIACALDAAIGISLF